MHGEAAAGGEIIGALAGRQQADGGGDGARFERLVERPQHVLRLRRTDMDDKGRIDAERGEALRIEHAAVAALPGRQRPQDMAGAGAHDARQQAHGEAERGGKVARFGRQAFVERAGGQPAAGQGAVDAAVAKTGDGPVGTPQALLTGDAGAQRRDGGPAAHGAHPSPAAAGHRPQSGQPAQPGSRCVQTICPSLCIRT